MKTLLFTLMSCVFAFGDTPSVLGNLNGSLFTSVASSIPIAIEGGTFSQCKTGNGDYPLTSCKVEGGKVKIGVEGKDQVIDLERLVHTLGKTFSVYTFFGTQTIRITNREVKQNVLVTVVKDMSGKSPIRGHVKLTDLETRNFFEVY